MISRKLLISAILLLGTGCIGGLESKNLSFFRAPLLSTHRIVPRPPLPTNNNQVLLVGLKSHLGRGTTDIETSTELRLISPGRALRLSDSNGLVHRAREISIAWRKISLLKSKSFARKVLGPYASFESAQNVAFELQQKGFFPEIAYPKDWEVWLPINVDLPKKFKAVLFTETIDFEVKPVLRGSSGEFLLSGPLQLEAPDGLLWQGGIYKGPFLLQADAYGGWTLVEQIALERYLEGVVPHEIGGGSPAAALEVQAVLARTWAIANSNRFLIDGYHLCSDTQCQVYQDPRQAGQKVKTAISKTSGKILSWRNQPIHAVYHASNGGVMASAREAWAMDSVPYLRAELDGIKTWRNSFLLPLNEYAVKSLLQNRVGAYGANHSLFRWNRTFSAEQIKMFLSSVKTNVTLPKTITVLERGRSGRVLALEIRESGNQDPIVLRLDQIRRIFRGLPSTLFVISKQAEGRWEFSGGGFGHGAGLSQAGAIDLAQRGWTVQEILSHYYPGTTFGPLPD